MNILFLNDYNVTNSGAGVSRVSLRLSEGFKKFYNWKCFLAYHFPSKEPTSPVFDKVILHDNTSFSTLRSFLRSTKIDFIICSKVGSKANYHFFSDFYEFLKEETQTKMIFIFHNRTYYDLFLLDLIDKIEKKWYSNKLLLISLKSARKMRIFQSFIRKKMQPHFSIPFDNCDNIVVLSSMYVPMYYKVAGRKDDNKIVAIGNPLVFDDFFPTSLLHTKQKEVLMVTRFQEHAKRITLALKIWDIIEKKNLCSDWILRIVGNGPDEAFVKEYAVKLNLKRVVFEGWQNPMDYYKRSSIFIMTSEFEGFPMTLNEAKQQGVTPIVFDSFESVYDIIENEYDGLIISNNDIESFVNGLVDVMTDSDKRLLLQTHSINTAERYSLENTCKKWEKLFTSIK